MRLRACPAPPGVIHFFDLDIAHARRRRDRGASLISACVRIRIVTVLPACILVLVEECDEGLEAQVWVVDCDQLDAWRVQCPLRDQEADASEA